MNPVNIIGGGLAGCEAAHRLAGRGVPVVLWEMKPGKFSPAHHSPNLAELVCSNSFRSDSAESAVGLLKEEMRRLNSLTMEAAEATRLPAGGALAVDRELFSQYVTKRIEETPLIELRREERLAPPQGQGPVILAAGPLVSEGLTKILAGLVSAPNLYFYDALAPVVTHDSLNLGKIYPGNRYGEPGQGDYLNCPLNKEEFEKFLEALLSADGVAPRPFEPELAEPQRFFEGCLPIEVMARRGPRTLTFGPMKPVGLENPQTGRRPWAVVQLRRENQGGTLWNMVGFQTRLTRPAQEKVFRLIPGLENAEFARFGAIHRNTYLEAPKVLDPWGRIMGHAGIFVAGQLSGVEGYVESAAHGILAGENAARQAKKLPLIAPPDSTALGALIGHLKPQEWRGVFAPSNVNFGLFSPPPPGTPKNARNAWLLARAHEDFNAFWGEAENAWREIV